MCFFAVFLMLTMGEMWSSGIFCYSTPEAFLGKKNPRVKWFSAPLMFYGAGYWNGFDSRLPLCSELKEFSVKRAAMSYRWPGNGENAIYADLCKRNSGADL